MGPAIATLSTTAPPQKGLEAFSMVWAGWLYSQEWWRRDLWRNGVPEGTTFDQALARFRTRFKADANDYILQARTWQRHDVGTTPGFDGDVERALRSIKVPILYMPSETDLYFPVGDARYEAAFIPGVTLLPIPSICPLICRRNRPSPSTAKTWNFTLEDPALMVRMVSMAITPPWSSPGGGARRHKGSPPRKTPAAPGANPRVT